jgi:hypothetical protein
MPASSVDWPYTAGLWRETANQDASHLGTYSAAAVPAPGATRTIVLGDGRDSGSTTDRASGSRRGHTVLVGTDVPPPSASCSMVSLLMAGGKLWIVLARLTL